MGDYVYRDRTYECKERIVCQGKRLLGYQLSVADVTAERARLEQLTEESKGGTVASTDEKPHACDHEPRPADTGACHYRSQ